MSCGYLLASKVAEEVCGNIPKETVIPWMKGRENEAAVFQAGLADKTRAQRSAVTRLREAEEAQNENEATTLRENVERTDQEKKECRKAYKLALKTWEREWWQGFIDEAKEASDRQDTG